VSRQVTAVAATPIPNASLVYPLTPRPRER